MLIKRALNKNAKFRLRVTHFMLTQCRAEERTHLRGLFNSNSKIFSTWEIFKLYLSLCLWQKSAPNPKYLCNKTLSHTKKIFFNDFKAILKFYKLNTCVAHWYREHIHVVLLCFTWCCSNRMCLSIPCNLFHPQLFGVRLFLVTQYVIGKFDLGY